jgi:hypothetical protein
LRVKRYPFGIPAWAHWSASILIAGILGNLPLIGGFVALGALVAATVVWMTTHREPDRRLVAYAPTPRTGDAALELAGSQEVVGESRHFADIHAAVKLGGRRLRAHLDVEPRNPRHRNAVAVRLVVPNGMFRCGYLPRHDAEALAPIIRANADRGLNTITSAAVFGGTPDKPNYGVWLRA